MLAAIAIAKTQAPAAVIQTAVCDPFIQRAPLDATKSVRDKNEENREWCLMLFSMRFRGFTSVAYVNRRQHRSTRIAVPKE